MTPQNLHQKDNDIDLSSKAFHELMGKRVNEILLVSSPYDAYIMEEDGRLAERIIHEYKGLNLSRPPRLTRVSTAKEALGVLQVKKFDVVIIMPRLGDMDPYLLGEEIKKKFKKLPVFFFAHDAGKLLEDSSKIDRSIIDRIFVWAGDTNLLLALIKNSEDRMNVEHDTKRANVRVIILVEDSPLYLSTLLPFLYKEIVMQTQSCMDESLNEEQRLLRMRARPKILVAESYEEAEHLYNKYLKYLLCIITDIRYPKGGKVVPDAGLQLSAMVRESSPDLPVLVLSNEEANRKKAEDVAKVFLNKCSPTLYTDIRSFFEEHLGFGDFVFRTEDGVEVGRASNLRSMARIMYSVPESSICFHAAKNDFSNWLMARFELRLAARLRPVKISDFTSPGDIKGYLISAIRDKLKGRQRGVVADFAQTDFAADTDFAKIGRGSLGGKARGLAFISTLLKKAGDFYDKYPGVDIRVPRTLVISTEGFDSFESENNLKRFSGKDLSDAQVEHHFENCSFPVWLEEDLRKYLSCIQVPLAVRSSSILEDAHCRPRAGAYNTFMLSNNHSDPEVRLSELVNAVKLVFASIYMEAPRILAKSSVYRTEEDKMAVIVQEVAGTHNGEYFYPAVAGVAQSYNFYPVSYMKPEEGIAFLALGLGQTVVEGGLSLRVSPKYPKFLPQFATIENVLDNSQRSFYALKMASNPDESTVGERPQLGKIDITDALSHYPVRALCSTFFPEDNKIRDTFDPKGHPVLTFAHILKYKMIPLAQILSDILSMGRRGMGCPVEIEFAVNLHEDDNLSHEFLLLQIRPMMVSRELGDVVIDEHERDTSICFSEKAMGGSQVTEISHIVFVVPDRFDPARTVAIAQEIRKINLEMEKNNQKYLLIGPGRWGSSDRWLGIPVVWGDISGVCSIVETTCDTLSAEPSQGSHFFHNITSLGISYISVGDDKTSHIDVDWLEGLGAVMETEHVRQVSLETPLTLKIDGKKSHAVIFDAALGKGGSAVTP